MEADFGIILLPKEIERTTVRNSLVQRIKERRYEEVLFVVVHRIMDIKVVRPSLVPGKNMAFRVILLKDNTSIVSDVV